MNSEINKDFYCTLYDDPNGCRGFDNQNTDGCFKKRYYYANNRKHRTKHCNQCHRKHPTPEQFREEYGREYPKDWAVYSKNNNQYDERTKRYGGKWAKWEVESYADFLKTVSNHHPDIAGRFIAVCAVTPFGRPGDNWRPE